MIHSLFQTFTWLGSEWVLAVLAVLSILIVAVALDRWHELRRMTRMSGRFWDDHVDAWFLRSEPGAWRSEIQKLRVAYPCLETEMLALFDKAQTEAPRSPEAKGGKLETLMEAFLNQRRMKLERHVGVLGTIGANAPFVGLLGTVLGIIRAFHQLSVQGLGNGMEGVMGGISEALVLTAAGLMVAIPAVVFFNLLTKRIGELVRRAESVGQLVLARGPVEGGR
jgi:biopolymer transport protein ExbB/TolQ